MGEAITCSDNALRIALRVVYNDRCQYCSSFNGNCIEHIFPRAKGGQHTFENVLLACEPCNSKKSDLILSDGYLGIMFAKAAQKKDQLKAQIRKARVSFPKLSTKVVSVEKLQYVFFNHGIVTEIDSPLDLNDCVEFSRFKTFSSRLAKDDLPLCLTPNDIIFLGCLMKTLVTVNGLTSQLIHGHITSHKDESGCRVLHEIDLPKIFYVLSDRAMHLEKLDGLVINNLPDAFALTTRFPKTLKTHPSDTNVALELS